GTGTYRSGSSGFPGSSRMRPSQRRSSTRSPSPPRSRGWTPALHGSGSDPDTMKGVEMQAETQPQKRTGLTIGAWVAAVLGVLVLAAGVTGIWADTSKRDDNGYFSA